MQAEYELSPEQMKRARAQEREHFNVAYQDRYKYAAILCPRQFDNDLFWSLVYQESAAWADPVDRAAKAAGLTEFVVIDLRFEEKALVCYPQLEAWVGEIVDLLTHSSSIDKMKQIVIDSVLGDNPDLIRQVEDVFASKQCYFSDDTSSDDADDDKSADFPSYPGFIGNPTFVPPTRAPSSSLWLTILNNFMIGAGAAAVILAFTALNASTFGLTGLAVAGLGAAMLAGGAYGFFKPANTATQMLNSMNNPLTP